MNMNAHCAEPPAQSNARGAQNAPQRAGAAYRAPVVASYDPGTHRLHWGSRVPGELSSPGTLAPRTLGEESWKWLFLQPLMKTQE
jgi:phospholipid/cholesterol/gamma-HCH transport system substrate-binding protein